MNLYDQCVRGIDNLRSSFGTMSIVFGSIFGFLIANGLQDAVFSWTDVVLLSVWIFVFALSGHNLLKIAENIIFLVNWTANLLSLVLTLIVVIGIGFYQSIIPVDPKVWVALIVAWVTATFLVAIIERPKKQQDIVDD